MPQRTTNTLLLFVQLVACWPVWRWYGLRLIDRSDEPWGLLALCTAIGLLGFKKSTRATAKINLLGPTMLLVVYAATFHVLPPLLRAVIAVTALGCLLSSWYCGRVFQPGLWGLLWLSLPVMASMQFYLGYPLRVIAGTCAAFLLRMGGFAVIREGTMLTWGGQLIAIDAPCSGVRMLWTGLYLTFTLALFYNLGTKKTLWTTGFSLSVILIGNSLRSAALFYLEAGLFTAPSWFHEGTGVIIFLIASIAIAWFTRKIQKDLTCEPLSLIS